MIPHLRSLLAAASVEGSTRGPGPMTAAHNIVFAADGDSIAETYWHPMLDVDALASLIAAAVSALPALIEVAEAAKEVQRAKAEWHRRRPFYSTAEAHSRVTMAEHYLAEALAKLEAP